MVLTFPPYMESPPILNFEFGLRHHSHFSMGGFSFTDLTLSSPVSTALNLPSLIPEISDLYAVYFSVFSLFFISSGSFFLTYTFYVLTESHPCVQNKSSSM